MKLAIMQPYFVPYLGYWQLLNAVDRFVIYDDVTYIKGGWINRNRILINKQPSYITVPLSQSSSFKKIYEISIHSSDAWRGKMIKSITNTYRKAPFFDEIFPVVEDIVLYQTNSLSDFLSYSITSLSNLMEIKTKIVLTSRIYNNSSLKSKERVIDICKRERAKIYINPIGGENLYDSASFGSVNIKLYFIVMRPVPYKQRVAGFVPYLSIIDELMEIGTLGVKKKLDKFELTAS